MDDCAKKTTSAFLVVALQLTLLSSCLCAKQTQFPYQALVVVDGAHVYSGPGKMHYATDSLATGDVVEVYRHDPGGWCAIRPPQGSFSLVPEAAIKIVGDDLGEVVEADSQAWVGTAMGAVDKPLWQVKLKAGEQVFILGEVSWPDADGHSTIWYQIAPPNGEFRWIHLDDIKLPAAELPEEFGQHNFAGPTEISGQFESYEQRNEGWRPAKLPFDEQEEIRLVSGVQEDGSRVVQAAPANPVGMLDEKPNENGFVTPRVQPQRFSGGGVTPVQPQRDLRQNRPERYASSDAAFGAVPPGQSLNPIAPLGGLRLSDRLRQIDVRLSTEVTKPSILDWNLNEIAIDAQSVVNSATSGEEAEAGRRLLEKINNFRRIFDNARSVQNANNPLGGNLGAAASEKATSIYDAEGWLNELVLRRGTVESTYVLEDDQGRITHHVQAAPGLNLHRYLRSKIGIMGQRGYHQQLELNHILVERLIVLEKPKGR